MYHCCAAGEVERGVPNTLVVGGVLTPEELLTAVKPWQWVLLAIERWERHLVDAWREYGEGTLVLLTGVVWQWQWRGGGASRSGCPGSDEDLADYFIDQRWCR